jgi:ribonuclease D
VVESVNPVWIDSDDGVERVVRCCREAGVVAVDTEADSLHSYYHKVCLIQLSAAGQTFLVDPLVCRARALSPLFEVLGQPEIPVLMHGADYDIRVLDRDFGARVRGLIDTQVMAQVLGEARTGLAALLAQELGIEVDKRYQRADWGRRPLPPACLTYAACDTAFLEELGQRLRRRIQVVGRWTWVEEECSRLERVRFSPGEPDPLAFERIKGARALRGVARDRAYTLHGWRERRAMEHDLPPFKIMGNRQIIHLAEKPANDIAALAKTGGLGPGFARRWGREVLQCLARPEEAPQRSPRPPWVAVKPAIKSRLGRLLEARDERAGELGIDGGLLCSRSLALALASVEPRPRSLADLQEAGLSGWRLEVVGRRLLGVCQEDW